MNKELPGVFANTLDKKINNVQETYYSLDRQKKNPDVASVLDKINSILTSNQHVVKSKVKIVTKDQEIIKDIIGKTNGHLLTLEGEKINIIDIIDIERI